jgi:hypothetical protein
VGHVLMENRNALLVAAGLDQASGTAEREEALKLVDAHRPVARGQNGRRITLGADNLVGGACSRRRYVRHRYARWRRS